MEIFNVNLNGGLSISAPAPASVILLNGLVGQENWSFTDPPGGTIGSTSSTSGEGLIIQASHWSNGYWGTIVDLTNVSSIRAVGLYNDPSDGYGDAFLEVGGTYASGEIRLNIFTGNTTDYAFDVTMDVTSVTGSKELRLCNSNADYVRYEYVEIF